MHMNHLKEMKSPERYRREIGIEDGRYMSSERNVTDRSMRVDVSEHARIQIVYTQDAKQVWELLGQKMGECRSFIRRNRSGRRVDSDLVLRRIRGGGWVMIGQEMGRNGVIVQYFWSGGWVGTERMYGAVGEKSIDFLEKSII